MVPAECAGKVIPSDSIGVHLNGIIPAEIIEAIIKCQENVVVVIQRIVQFGIYIKELKAETFVEVFQVCQPVEG